MPRYAGCCCCACRNGDVLMLLDSTGSMSGAIATVQEAYNHLLTTLNADVPTDKRCRWALADYKDYVDGGPYTSANGGIKVYQTLTNDLTAVASALETVTAGGGGDTPEEQMKTLQTICRHWVSKIGGDTEKVTSPSGNLVYKRRRSIIWVGDVEGHEGFVPGLGDYPTLAQLGECFKDLDTCIQIIAIDAGGLNSTGQASQLAKWTHGRLFSLSTEPEQLAEQICAALRAERWEC